MDLRKRNSWDDAISIEETAVKAGAVHGAYSATQRRKSRRTSSSAGVSRRSSQGIKASNKSSGDGRAQCAVLHDALGAWFHPAQAVLHRAFRRGANLCRQF